MYVLLADISPDYLLSLRERAADHYRRVYGIGVLITPNSVCIRAIIRSLRARIKCTAIFFNIVTILSYRLLYGYVFNILEYMDTRYKIYSRIYEHRCETYLNQRLSLFLHKTSYR